LNSVEQQRPAFSRPAHFMVRLLAYLLLCVGPMAAGPGLVSAADVRSANGGSSQPITLNFKDADIDSVIGAFGHLLNRTFIIDPRVRGKITVETARPVSPQAAYELLQSSLRLQGFAIVETGSISRVVPEADAKLQSGPVNAGRSPTAGGEQIVTQVFRLVYESASNLVPVLRPLIAPNNTIVAYPNNNSLVVTDYASNLQRLARIIATLDSPVAGEVEVVAMRHALASDVALQVSVDDFQSRPDASLEGQVLSLLALLVQKCKY
jgi:general secretion pathway protein D